MFLIESAFGALVNAERVTAFGIRKEVDPNGRDWFQVWADDICLTKRTDVETAKASLHDLKACLFEKVAQDHWVIRSESFCRTVEGSEE